MEWECETGYGTEFREWMAHFFSTAEIASLLSTTIYYNIYNRCPIIVECLDQKWSQAWSLFCKLLHLLCFRRGLHEAEPAGGSWPLVQRVPSVQAWPHTCPPDLRQTSVHHRRSHHTNTHQRKWKKKTQETKCYLCNRSLWLSVM